MPLYLPAIPGVKQAAASPLKDPSSGTAQHRAISAAGGAMQRTAVFAESAKRHDAKQQQALEAESEKLAEEERKLRRDAYLNDYETRRYSVDEAITSFGADSANSAEDVREYAAGVWDSRRDEIDESLEGSDPEFSLEVRQRYDLDRAKYFAKLNPSLVKRQVDDHNARTLMLMGKQHDSGDMDGFARSMSTLRMSVAAKEGAARDILKKGAYQDVSDMISDAVFYNNADALRDLASELESSKGEYSYLEKNQRGQLALRAQSGWRNVELAQRKLFKSRVREVAKTGFIDEGELSEELKNGQITEDQYDSIVAMAPDAKRAIEESSRYAEDRKGKLFREYRRARFEEYFQRRADGKNVAVAEDDAKDTIADISALPLGNWAKADLYAEHLQTLSLAVAEDDSRWFRDDFAEDLTDSQRKFWSSYLNALSRVVSDSQPDIDLGSMIESDVENVEIMFSGATAPETDEQYRELMGRMLTPYLEASAIKAVSASLPVVDSQEDYDNLTAGERYIDSYGNEGVKR